MNCDPEKTYDWICRQIEREALLWRARINTCLLINGAIGAAALSQTSSLGSSLVSLLIFLFCCGAGMIINKETAAELENGWKQSLYLYNEFWALDESHPSKFPRPFLPTDEYTSNLPKWLRSYPDLFGSLWAIAAFIGIILGFAS